MEEITIKTLKQLSRLNIAKDVTNCEKPPLKKQVLANSFGKYGWNGCLYKDYNGNLYTIIGYASNLYKI